MTDKVVKRDLIREALQNLEREELVDVLDRLSPDDVHDALIAVQPLAFHEYLGLMLTTTNDKVKYYMLKDMLKMGGHGGIQKVAINKRVNITAEDREWRAHVEEEMNTDE